MMNICALVKPILSNIELPESLRECFEYVILFSYCLILFSRQLMALFVPVTAKEIALLPPDAPQEGDKISDMEEFLDKFFDLCEAYCK